jgi:hypothetical protein
MEQRSLWFEVFAQWKEERVSQWKRPPASLSHACLPNSILYCCFENVDFYVC